VRFFSGTFLRLLETLRFPLSQPQKRRKQPERYAKFCLNLFKKYIAKDL
jgi:hypothetical protein